MTREIVEPKPLPTASTGWAEEVQASRARHLQLGKKLATFSDINEEDFSGLTVEREIHFQNYCTISTTLTSDEVVQAPPPIRKVMNDLGLSGENTLELSVRFNPQSFTILIDPDGITPDKFGITMKSDGNFSIVAPTERVYDGVHQMADSRYGKGAQMARIYEDYLAPGITRLPHPIVLDILEAGANWAALIINSRRNSTIQSSPL